MSLFYVVKTKDFRRRSDAYKVRVGASSDETAIQMGPKGTAAIINSTRELAAVSVSATGKDFLHETAQLLSACSQRIEEKEMFTPTKANET